MSDFPLPGYCVDIFEFFTGKESSGYADVSPLIVDDGYTYLVDILTVTARRNTGDSWCNAIVYLGNETEPAQRPIAGAAAVAESSEDLAATEVSTWVSQSPFWLPLAGTLQLILGTDNAGVSGASWGACYCAGRIFSALN